MIPIDVALAKYVLKEDFNEEEAYLIYHLSKAMRAGHLCISIDEDRLLPPVRDLWESKEELSLEELEQIKRKILAGGKKKRISPTLHWEGTRLYFQKYWKQEATLLEKYRLLKQTSPFPPIRSEFQKQGLLEEQIQAIQQASQNSLTIICGGPGTGKTYTAGHLIRIIWEALSSEEQRNFHFALAAPTGKAAANLQKSLQRALGNLKNFKPIQAQTLHNLLHLSKKYREPEFLNADFILIDESSMLDMQMFSSLLESIKPGARLVLVGDPHQLPPVEIGGLFADLVKLENENAIFLKTCMRTDLSEIVTFSQHLLEGDADLAWDCLKVEGNVRKVSSELNHKIFLDLVTKKFVPPSHLEPLQLLEYFNQFRILSPLRKGPWGTDFLNELLYHHLPKGIPFPIMITKNVPKLNLYNGEVGVQIGDNVFFQGEPFRLLPLALIPSYEYAFCLSIHKSQGSEFNHVFTLLPEGSEIFGREILYTAATRARKQLDLICSKETFQKTLSKKSERLSGLKYEFVCLE